VRGTVKYKEAIMKKKGKNKEKKKAEMPEFEFKEFTPEEGRIYEEAVVTFREGLTAGKTLREAYELYEIADKELEALVRADFLKILIAERHFAKQEPLEKIARDLDVSQNLIMESHARMLQEAGISAANEFGKEFGSLSSETDD
jgi:hypothetical protein